MSNIITIVDNQTKEIATFEKIPELPENAVANGITYGKKGDKFYRRVFPNNEINAKIFGLKGDGSDEVLKLRELVSFARENKLNIYFPAGLYNSGDFCFPWHLTQYGKTPLQDYHHTTVRGDGRRTVFMTISKDGSDVLQLNNIKNITFKDISITAQVSNIPTDGVEKSGSNGISITNGFDNITLDNIYVYDLGYVQKDGYIDGGKALTIQNSHHNANGFGRLYVRNFVSFNNPYGFRHDAYLDDLEDSFDIDIEMKIERAWNGVGICFEGLSQNKPLKLQNYKLKALLVDCMQDLHCNRLNGGEIDLIVNSSKTLSELKKNHHGDNWRDSTHTSNIFHRKALTAYIGWAKNTKITILGKKENDVKYLLGSVGDLAENFQSAATEKSLIKLGVDGGFTENELIINTNSANNENLNDCRLEFLNFQSEIPATIKKPSNYIEKNNQKVL